MGAWGAVSSLVSLIDVESVISFLTLLSMDEDIDDITDMIETNALPVREVLDHGEKVLATLKAVQAKWAVEIKGAGLGHWSDKNLAEAM